MKSYDKKKLFNIFLENKKSKLRVLIYEENPNFNFITK